MSLKIICNILVCFMSVLFGNSICGQVGIGTSNPHPSAMLDVSGSNKGVLIPRVALIDPFDVTTISNGNVDGLLVFNTTSDGHLTPGFYYWQDEVWNRLSTQGQSLSIEASNGLHVDGGSGDVVLGGELEQPTVLETSLENFLSLTGLQDVSSVDHVLVLEDGTDKVSKALPSSVVKASAISYTAIEGQVQFTTPETLTDMAKLAVYRNGVLIEAEMINANTVELESGVTCHQGDEIKIVQYR